MNRWLSLAFLLVLMSGCGKLSSSQVAEKHLSESVEKLIAGAVEQIGVTVSYDPAYVGLEYPGGDVPEDRGYAPT